MSRLAKMHPRREKKFQVRVRNRCPQCGRPRAFLRKFKLCRMALRDLALTGRIPGMVKSSW